MYMGREKRGNPWRESKKGSKRVNVLAAFLEKGARKKKNKNPISS